MREVREETGLARGDIAGRDEIRAQLFAVIDNGETRFEVYYGEAGYNSRSRVYHVIESWKMTPWNSEHPWQEHRAPKLDKMYIRPSEVHDDVQDEFGYDHIQLNWGMGTSSKELEACLREASSFSRCDKCGEVMRAVVRRGSRHFCSDCLEMCCAAAAKAISTAAYDALSSPYTRIGLKRLESLYKEAALTGKRQHLY